MNDHQSTLDRLVHDADDVQLCKLLREHTYAVAWLDIDGKFLIDIVADSGTSDAFDSVVIACSAVEKYDELVSDSITFGEQVALFICDGNWVQVVRAMKALGVNLDSAFSSQSGQTLLMYAAISSPDVVEALLDCGASPNVQSREGTTALMCACDVNSSAGWVTATQQCRMIKRLLKAGADFDIPNNHGVTARMLLRQICDYFDGFANELKLHGIDVQ
jgi:ankyrin repeat protein